MKKFVRYCWIGALALVTVGFTSCSENEDPAPAPLETPEIAISAVTATASGAQFTLTPTHAVRYTYAVAPKGESGQETEVRSAEATTQQVDGLDADRLYTITAVAYAADGTKSLPATHDFTTNAMPSVVIGDQIAVTFKGAELTLTPTNATSVSYVCYPAEQRPAEPTWIEVEGNDPFEVTLSGLESDTEYRLEAYASNAEGDGETVLSPVFRTDLAPEIAIGEVNVAVTSATFTLTPSHAEGMKYVCYAAAQRPAEPAWVNLEKSEATKVTVTALAPNTEYVVEAFAYTTAGDGEPVVSEPFRTQEAAALTLTTVGTANAIWARFEMNPSKTAGYYFSSPVDPTDEFADFTTAEEFLQDIAENGWLYELKTTDFEWVASAAPSTAYKLFAVCADAAGNADESTVQEVTVTTAALDRTGSGSATAQIGSIEPAATMLGAQLTFSDDCIMYVAGALSKSDADRVGGVNVYINMNLPGFTPRSAAALQNPISFPSLSPETDYYIYCIAIDREGKFGTIVTEQTRTTAVSYDPAVTAEISVYEQGYTGMTFDIRTTGAPTLRYRNLLRSELLSFYDNDEEQVYAELFNDTADQIYLDENGRFRLDWLTYNSDYVLFVLPVKDDGSFGTRTKLTYKTGKFEATGSAVLTFEKLTTNPDGGGIVTLTPGAGCAKFIYMEVGQEVYEQYSRRLGDYVMSAGYYTIIDPAEETEVEVMLWGEDTYLVAIAADDQGRWSEPVFQPFIYPGDQGY